MNMDESLSNIGIMYPNGDYQKTLKATAGKKQKK